MISHLLSSVPFHNRRVAIREEKVNVDNICMNKKWLYSEEISKNVINPKTNVYQIINNENGRKQI